MESKTLPTKGEPTWPLILIDASVLLTDPQVIVRVIANSGLPVISDTAVGIVESAQSDTRHVVSSNARIAYQSLLESTSVKMDAMPNGRRLLPGDTLHRLQFKDCPVYVLGRAQSGRATGPNDVVIGAAKDYGMRLITRDPETKVRANLMGAKADLWSGPPSTSPSDAVRTVVPPNEATPLPERTSGTAPYSTPAGHRSSNRLTVGIAAAIVVALLATWLFWPEPSIEARFAPGEETLIMRTKGGTLEVATIRTVQTFTRTTDHSILWIPLGQTVTRIRVPAYFRYHIDLAPEWPVRVRDNVFTVISPTEEPTLPVAVDLAQMEKEASGVWSFFTGTDELEELQRSITAALAQRAELAKYRQMQREDARKTVSEFVEKWLITQTQWKSSSKPTVQVLFADEA